MAQTEALTAVKRQLWINLGLLGLVLLLAALVWLTHEESSTPELPVLTALQPEQIHTIRIRNKNGEFELARQGDGWVMTRPYKSAANGVRIEQLLPIASTPSFEHFSVPEERLREFGLAEPQAELWLNDLAIQMGSTNPIHHRRYLRMGDTVHLIADRFPHHLLSTAEGFVALELLPPGGNLRAIHTPQWQLAKETDGRLTLNPPNPALTTDDLNRKFDQWRFTQAIGVTPLPPETSEETLELILDGREAPLRFLIVRREKQTLLLRPDLGIAYRLPGGPELLAPPKAKE